MKVLLICATGISTHAFSDLLAKEANQAGSPLELKSISAEMAQQADKQTDHVLLALQIRFNQSKIASLFYPAPVDVIDTESFASGNVEPVL